MKKFALKYSKKLYFNIGLMLQYRYGQIKHKDPNDNSETYCTKLNDISHHKYTQLIFFMLKYKQENASKSPSHAL